MHKITPTIIILAFLALPLSGIEAATKVSPACITITKELKIKSKDTTTSTQVASLQGFLKAKGYKISDKSGTFGTSTQSAVKKFQTNSGIKPANGIVGKSTRAKIKADCSNNKSKKTDSIPVTKATSTVAVVVESPECNARCMDLMKDDPVVRSVNGTSVEIFEGVKFNSGDTVSIIGSNLTYKGNDTKVLFEDEELKITKFSKELVKFVAPEGLATGYYNMVVANSHGQGHGFRVEYINPEKEPKYKLGSNMTLTCKDVTFNRELRLGASGNDVIALENFLKSKGYFKGETTGYFTTIVQKALNDYYKSKDFYIAEGYLGMMGKLMINTDCQSM